MARLTVDEAIGDHRDFEYVEAGALSGGRTNVNLGQGENE
jgi:hypothetical protein